ncbi:MAG: hypothetical protein ACRCTQ_03590 [Brevinemataceae bacterium]
MKFYLLLIILLLNGCADNKKQSADQSQIAASGNTQVNNEISNSNDVFILDSRSHKIISNIPSLNISTNPTFLNSNSNYVLSYGLTPEVYLLETLNNLERYGYYWEYISFGSEDSILDGKISNNTYYIYGDTVWYISMYYSPQNNKYYIVQDIEIVSNVHTLFSNINTNIQEPFFFELYRAYPETNIIYIADISTNERLYYKPDNNSYLVKTLKLIKDSQYKHTIISDSGIIYSNTEGLIFSRDDRTFEPYILEF